MTIPQEQMLDEIIKSRGVSYDAALERNQTIFGSLCYHKWLSWDIDKKRFYVNGEGLEARREATTRALYRKVNNHKLALRAQPVLRHRTESRHRGLKRVA